LSSLSVCLCIFHLSYLFLCSFFHLSYFSSVSFVYKHKKNFFILIVTFLRNQFFFNFLTINYIFYVYSHWLVRYQTNPNAHNKYLKHFNIQNFKISGIMPNIRSNYIFTYIISQASKVF
jgi:hypothetical protein